MRSLGALLALVVAGCSAGEPPLATIQPPRVQAARDIGAVDRAEPIDLVLLLKLHDVEQLKTVIALQADPGSSLYRKYLSPVEFGDSYGPAAGEYARVVAWAEASGLTVTRKEPSRTSLSVRGSAADIERAFGTRLRRYQDRAGIFRAPDGPLHYQPEVSQLLVTVLGLDDASRWHSHMTSRTPVADPDNSPQPGRAQQPSDLRALYNVDQISLEGEGETIAILGTGYPPDPANDVGSFIRKYKAQLPGTSYEAQMTQVFLGGPNRDPDTLANNEYGENLLDIDMAIGLAPKASYVHVFAATNAGGLFMDGITYIINNVPQAHAASVSYGLCERYTASEILFLNNQFMQAKAQGQTWFFASGDDGTDDCRDGAGNKVLSVEWPASSPYAVGVGGTQLDTSGAEQAWGGSGGGQSEIIAKPAYQIGVGPYPNDGAREVPDVAALAGSPGVATVAGSQVFASQGTSAATPIVASIWLLVDQAKGGAGLTNFHERIYALGQAGSTAFHDITVGGNVNGAGMSAGGYRALPGFDLVTGWGTFNAAQLISQW